MFQKGNQYGKMNKGKTHIAWNKGKIMDTAHRQKLSKSHKGQIPWNKNKKIGKQSKEHRLKIGLGNKGKTIKKETKEKMRNAAINYIKTTYGNVRPRIGRNEKKILDKLEKIFKYKIIRQYSICGYFVDGYISELNLVIEIDERPKITERDIEREKIIKQKINCRFIRINDYD